MRADIRKSAPPKLIYATKTYQYDNVDVKEDHIQKMWQSGWRVKTERKVSSTSETIKHVNDDLNIINEKSQVTFFR